MRTLSEATVAIMLLGSLAFGQTTMPAIPTKPVLPPGARLACIADRQTMGTSYLGVEIRDLAPERAGQLGLKDTHGIEITMVDHDSPAGKVGLREQDVIVSINGRQLDSADQLRRVIHGIAPGTSIQLGLIRGGQPQTMAVQLGKRPRLQAGGPILVPAMPSLPSDFDIPQTSAVPSLSRSGLVVEDLTPQLGEFFGVRKGEGVLVRSVERGSPAAAAGLRAGDVIVKVDGQAITCSSDWRYAMAHRANDTVAFGVVRDKREQTISVKLPARRSS